MSASAISEVSSFVGSWPPIFPSLFHGAVMLTPCSAGAFESRYPSGWRDQAIENVTDPELGRSCEEKGWVGFSRQLVY